MEFHGASQKLPNANFECLQRKITHIRESLMKKILMGLAATGMAMSMSSAANAAECGEVSIADWNWPSGELMAAVDKFILENGYGCTVELIPGATMTTFASMNEKGVPQVAGELWINAVREPLNAAMDEGRIISVKEGPITDLGEGWWVTPEWKAAHPELKTVMDIIERPDLFPYKEDPSKGAFITCPSGWGCQLTNNNLFRAFDMEAKGWALVDPGSSAGLDGSMAKAAERGEPWFGYYWAPTALIGKYNMQLVPFGVDFVGAEHWDSCIVKDDCADPKPSSWTKSEVHTVVTKDFAAKGGEMMEYLGNRVYPGAVMGAMLVYMGDNQAGGEDAAIEFLASHEDVWTAWVPAEVAAKVKGAL
jgi:glycine betaine/proline transport system substrate-binding protein